MFLFLGTGFNIHNYLYKRHVNNRIKRDHCHKICAVDSGCKGLRIQSTLREAGLMHPCYVMGTYKEFKAGNLK